MYRLLFRLPTSYSFFALFFAVFFALFYDYIDKGYRITELPFFPIRMYIYTNTYVYTYILRPN